jgi:hypothetical protein
VNVIAGVYTHSRLRSLWENETPTFDQILVRVPGERTTTQVFETELVLSIHLCHATSRKRSFQSRRDRPWKIWNAVTAMRLLFKLFFFDVLVSQEVHAERGLLPWRISM